jgi:uncharacterized protein (DUF342 family)
MTMSHRVQPGTAAGVKHAYLTDDRLEVRVNCTIPVNGTADEVKRVRAELVEIGISDEAMLEEASQRLEAAAATSLKLEEVVLLEGVPPVPPVDGTIEWKGDFHKDGFVVDSKTDLIDYRQPAAERSVSEGQALARVIPPVPGKDGVDVLGRTIEPRSPHPARIKEGTNVRFEPGEDTYYAKENGRIRYVGGRLSVDTVFKITGNVGLKSGNINHPGALVVNQDIQSGSKVDAAGDIDVGGCLEDAEVSTGGNLTVRGGIAGRTQCKIKVAGTLRANFLQNATIEAGGDVIVTHEIDQCTISALGAVVIPDGRIVGGEVNALAGIEARQLGSTACVTTILITGKDKRIETRIKEKQDELKTLNETRKKFDDKLAPLRRRISTLQGKAKEQVALLIQGARKLDIQAEGFQRQLDAIFEESRRARDKKILVHQQIFPGVKVHIGPMSSTVQSELRGAVKVEIKNKEIRFSKPKGRTDGPIPS